MRSFLVTLLLVAICLSVPDTICADELEEAINKYSEAIRKNPKDADAFNERGILWIEKGESDKAIKDVTEAIRLNPLHSDAFNSRGIAWRQKGEIDKAIKDYTEAIRLKHSGALGNRGILWAEQGDHDKAIKDLTELIQLDPKESIAFSFRGDSWGSKGDHAKAIKDYEEAIRLMPSNRYALNGLAWLFSTAKDPKLRDGNRAVKLASKACMLSKWKHYGYLSVLSAAYAESGDFKNAIKWQRKAIELAPNAERQDYRHRLKLYEAGNPFRA